MSTDRRAPGPIIAATCIALLMVAGCKEEKADPAAVLPQDRARRLAEDNIRKGSATPDRMRFRGVQAYTQMLPGRTAVCGQVSPFADNANAFVPFVSVVTAQAAQGDAAPEYTFEQHVGTSTSEASRTYAAIVGFCYDKGGPSGTPYQGAMPLPPLPDVVPDASGKAAAASSLRPDARPVQLPREGDAAAGADGAQSPLPSQKTAWGSVTMRQNGNLHSTPQGASLRVVSQGTVLQVFATAAGGWYQVGDNVPWGWIHSSMLERR